MRLDKIPPFGSKKQSTDDMHVVIEIPQGSGAIKYEIDKKSGALFVDRFLGTAMVYPLSYGFIPGTLSNDGDPCDVLVYSHVPVIAGSVVRCRPIGALKMTDESGQDEKIVAVPISKLGKQYEQIKSCDDLPPGLPEQIEHFFEHYKDLEKGKWVKTEGWEDAKGAKRLIEESLERVLKDAA